MNDNALSDLLARDLSDAEMDRALLDLTLEAAPSAVADAVRVCALPAWFDAAHLTLLTGGELEEAEDLIEKVAEFSFVLPREDGGYVYHEATRERLLDGWRDPERAARFTKLSQRLVRYYLNLARRQRPRLSGADYLDALATMDASYPNIVAAWERAFELGEMELLRGFAYALADYFDRRGLWEEKIHWAQRALDLCELEEDAESWADMQIILGNAYRNLPTGDRGANLQRAIECYQDALTVHTPEAAPLDYAMTQNNLGNAYADLSTGDRGANLQRAIECYQEALTVYTSEAAPFQYATTQNNLGTAYQELPTGDRGANLQRAIECYQEALRFRTPEAAPLQ
jgi:tetratricopeptide (TPR) repeat protein